MVVDPDCLPKDWDANSSKTQEFGDENMGARRNAAPQMALGGHFSLTRLICIGDFYNLQVAYMGNAGFWIFG